MCIAQYFTVRNTFLIAAQLSAEYRDVFSESGDYTTRGLHFHEEALRLWYGSAGHSNKMERSRMLTADSFCI